MDAVSELASALGAELLRARLLGQSRPRLADRYRVDDILGRGATGVVVAARDEDLGRDLALKLTLEEPGDTSLREAKSLASLEHVNVVMLYDASVASIVLGGRKFRVRILCMQKIDGVSLRVWLRERRRKPDRILAVFLGAGAGLAAAHAKNIVHRDFKPDNVLVASDGTAKVLDFGFALAASSTRSAEEGRPSGVAGTFAYMAPEAREGRASTRSDQYSFAMSLAEALSGELRQPTATLPDGVSVAAWTAIRKATEDDPDNRFESMNELLAELRASPAVRGGSWRRVGVLGVGLAVAAIAIVIASAGTWRRALPSLREPAAAEATELRRVDAVHVGEAVPEVLVASPDAATVEVVEPPPTCIAGDELFAMRTIDGARTSSYEVTVTRAEDCQLSVGLRRTRTGADHATQLDQTLTTSDAILTPTGELRFAAELTAADRTYAFSFPTGSSNGTGSFTSDDPRHGPVAGTLEVERVSHFDPVVGHQP